MTIITREALLPGGLCYRPDRVVPDDLASVTIGYDGKWRITTFDDLERERQEKEQAKRNAEMREAKMRSPRRLYLIAEYCAGPFYMGWWLYLRERNDGSENEGGWGWQRGEFLLEAIRRFLVSLNIAESLFEPPIVRRHGQELATWFAGKFPGGLLVDWTERPERREDEFKLVEIVAKVPKQVDRRIIRTIRKAEAAFARVCREDAAE